MTMRCKPAALAAGILLLGAASTAMAAEAKGKMAPSIDGAWKVTKVVITGANPLTVTNPQDSLWIFSHGHYANVQVTGEKARTAAPAPKDPAHPTDAEKLARYEEWAPFGAQAGSYTLKGHTLTRTATVAKNVGAMDGKPYDSEVKLSGDTLVIVSKSAAGQPAREQTLTFTRVK